MTFYICPTCGTFWSPAGHLFTTDPAERVNGGARSCPDCRNAYHQHQETLDAARDDARYDN